MRFNQYFILSGKEMTWATDDLLPMKDLVAKQNMCYPALIKDNLVFFYQEYYHRSVSSCGKYTNNDKTISTIICYKTDDPCKEREHLLSET